MDPITAWSGEADYKDPEVRRLRRCSVRFGKVALTVVDYENTMKHPLPAPLLEHERSALWTDWNKMLHLDLPWTSAESFNRDHAEQVKATLPHRRVFYQDQEGGPVEEI